MVQCLAQVPGRMQHVRGGDDIEVAGREPLRGRIAFDVEALELHEGVVGAERSAPVAQEAKRDVRVHVPHPVAPAAQRGEHARGGATGARADLQYPHRTGAVVPVEVRGHRLCRQLVEPVGQRVTPVDSLHLAGRGAGEHDRRGLHLAAQQLGVPVDAGGEQIHVRGHLRAPLAQLPALDGQVPGTQASHGRGRGQPLAIAAQITGCDEHVQQRREQARLVRHYAQLSAQRDCRPPLTRVAESTHLPQRREQQRGAQVIQPAVRGQQPVPIGLRTQDTVTQRIPADVARWHGLADGGWLRLRRRAALHPEPPQHPPFRLEHHGLRNAVGEDGF